jgi:DNA segregation ATPase FtsK/SpoIIIE, S-DNA-T family
MSGCLFPSHHDPDSRGLSLAVVAFAVLAAVVVLAARAVVVFAAAHWAWFAAAGLAVLAAGVTRVALLPAGSRRYWLLARWHRFTFKRLARNVGIARIDQHRGGIDSIRPPKVNYPRARFRPDPHGWVVNVRLTHGVSRESFEKASVHLANAWGAHRVGISQPRPNRLLVRAVRRDPLTESLSADVLGPFDGRRVTLGRDQWGAIRTADLANLSGSLIAGNPGRGKSESASSLAVQLVPSPLVETYILDGGGGLDWSMFDGLVHRYATELGDVRDALEDINARMVTRRQTMLSDLGVRNAWHLGPSREYPLIWVLVDECQAFLDASGAKGTPREKQIQACQGLMADLLRRGRAPMVHTSLLTQKPVSTSLPTATRDLCGLRWSFGVATLEAAVAALGDDIRPLESMHPTKLQGPEHVGIATVLLATGTDIYTQLKFPRIGDDVVRQAAAATVPAGIPAEPVQVLPAAGPRPASQQVLT